MSLQLRQVMLWLSSEQFRKSSFSFLDPRIVGRNCRSTSVCQSRGTTGCSACNRQPARWIGWCIGGTTWWFRREHEDMWWCWKYFAKYSQLPFLSAAAILGRFTSIGQPHSKRLQDPMMNVRDAINDIQWLKQTVNEKREKLMTFLDKGTALYQEWDITIECRTRRNKSMPGESADDAGLTWRE